MRWPRTSPVALWLPACPAPCQPEADGRLAAELFPLNRSSAQLMALSHFWAPLGLCAAHPPAPITRPHQPEHRGRQQLPERHPLGS